MENNLQERITKVMSRLPTDILKLGADRKYVAPYIQHVPEEVESVQIEFLKICAEVLKSDYYIDGKVHRQGIVGRFLDDSGNKILYANWLRFMCIDEYYREWCQPHYAINYERYNIDKCCCINDKYPELVGYFRDKKIDVVLNKKVEN